MSRRRTVTSTNTDIDNSFGDETDRCHEIIMQMTESLHRLHNHKKPPHALRKAGEIAYKLKGNSNCEYVISKVLDAYLDSDVSETNIKKAQNVAKRQIREDNCKDIMSNLKISLNANIFKSKPINLTHPVSAFDISKCEKYFQLKQRKEISDIQMYKIEKTNDKLFTHFSWKLNKKSKMLYIGFIPLEKV